jgi:hypothetical protein
MTEVDRNPDRSTIGLRRELRQERRTNRRARVLSYIVAVLVGLERQQGNGEEDGSERHDHLPVHQRRGVKPLENEEDEQGVGILDASSISPGLCHQHLCSPGSRNKRPSGSSKAW